MAKGKKDIVNIPKEVFNEMEAEQNLSDIDKVEVLGLLLTYTTIDTDKTIFGGEPIYKSIFSDSEIAEIKEKIMLIVRRF
jgi:hypothetical protein